MTWASMLYNFDFVPVAKPNSESLASSWETIGSQQKFPLTNTTPPTHNSQASPCRNGVTFKPEADCSSGSQRLLTSRAKHGRALSIDEEQQYKELSLQDPNLYPLPQRPGTAITRDNHRVQYRSPATAKLCARLGSYRTRLPANLSPITNDGLYLSAHDASSTPQAQSRSEDRILATQRLYQALDQSSRIQCKAASSSDTSLSVKRPRPCMSLLRGLSAQAYRRNSQPNCHSEPLKDDSTMPEFAPTMHGTYQCVVATQNSAIALVITPPSPRPGCDATSSDIGSGVRFTSHRRPEASVDPAEPSSLVPPPFQLAPGRAQQVARRRRQAAERLVKSYTNYDRSLQCASTIQINTKEPTQLMPKLIQTGVQSSQVPSKKLTATKDSPFQSLGNKSSVDHFATPPRQYTCLDRRRRMPTRLSHSPMRIPKVRTHDLHNKSKADLTSLLEEQKAELLQLRVQKVAGGGSSKLGRINTVRKNIARTLTIINLKQRASLREFYKGKKYQPLDLRPKMTRALRRKLTKHEQKQVTERQHKKNVHFGTRRYVIKA
ncbi:60S ribosomal protein L35, L29 [Malassezia psittaci]|uniref:60S ribosomal protein L35, L29 n=1 Tax=Malassezia psittaci TaxID=1821823 RepID=A0AAF0F3P8_9BASI|nr:60S ribosomal protein L35, L29 [Malassezia psittaci]